MRVSQIALLPTLALRVETTPPPTWTCRTGVVVTPPFADERASERGPRSRSRGTSSERVARRAADDHIREASERAPVLNRLCRDSPNAALSGVYRETPARAW